MDFNYHVDLDVLEHDDQQFADYLTENGITLTVLKKNGPAGCTLIRFNGSYDALSKLIADYYFDSECVNDIEPNR
ncbi:MAG: hypothetical protein ACOYL3_06745 [Desulfuromonadaceae bacterium]